MADKVPAAKGITPDWLVRGVLTKVGDIFDRLTGRGWKPSSSLATSELIEKLKTLLDAEVREDTPGCKFVPNNIKLKMQWDKFSTDSEEGLRKLQAEMLAAVVDHINDKRYFTHAPLALEIKPDYFTPGVRLLVSFDKFADEDHEAALNLMPGETKEVTSSEEGIAAPVAERSFVAAYSLNGIDKTKRINFTGRKRLSVGRTKENDLFIEDPSISKIHASLTINSKDQLVVADTGSTNGTFIGDERIPYGKTAIVGENGMVKFGTVEVQFKSEQIPRPSDNLSDVEKTEVLPPVQLDVSARMETVAPLAVNDNAKPSEDGEPFEPAPTEPSVPAPTLPSFEIEKDK
ncbi:MAG TPA: FHA domain-containing protein [Pyrinomonadaceae bacterium]|nr:FHA domain-containing protein [Pyrinomonadaceae bacterium]